MNFIPTVFLFCLEKNLEIQLGHLKCVHFKMGNRLPADQGKVESSLVIPWKMSTDASSTHDHIGSYGPTAHCCRWPQNRLVWSWRLQHVNLCNIVYSRRTRVFFNRSSRKDCTLQQHRAIQNVRNKSLLITTSYVQNAIASVWYHWVYTCSETTVCFDLVTVKILCRMNVCIDFVLSTLLVLLLIYFLLLTVHPSNNQSVAKEAVFSKEMCTDLFQTLYSFN